MSPLDDIAEALRQVEEALDRGDFEALATLDVALPPGPVGDLGTVAELDRLLTRTNQLRTRIASQLDEVGAELGALDSKRTAGRAYLAADTAAPARS